MHKTETGYAKPHDQESYGIRTNIVRAKPVRTRTKSMTDMYKSDDFYA